MFDGEGLAQGLHWTCRRQTRMWAGGRAAVRPSVRAGIWRLTWSAGQSLEKGRDSRGGVKGGGWAKQGRRRFLSGWFLGERAEGETETPVKALEVWIWNPVVALDVSQMGQSRGGAKPLQLASLLLSTGVHPIVEVARSSPFFVSALSELPL